MGWKASCILINERSPGYLGTMPPHDTERARRLIDDLGLGPCRTRGMTTLLGNLHPVDLIVGAYDGAAIIGAPEVVNTCFAPFERGRSPSDDPLMGRILRAFPRGSVLCIVLHSVVDLFGYAYFDDGRLIRAFGGADGDPILMDVGEWQPEERPLFEKSVERDSQRFFRVEYRGEVEEVDAPTVGAELTFAMTRRFFGCRLDELLAGSNASSLQVETFDRRRGDRSNLESMRG
jgi:hypothetical protein